MENQAPPGDLCPALSAEPAPSLLQRLQGHQGGLPTKKWIQKVAETLPKSR